MTQARATPSVATNASTAGGGESVRAGAAASLDVTVVVPVRNEGRHVEAVLSDLLAQEFPADRMEVLVVDGRSTDDTRKRVGALATRDARVLLLDNPGRLSSCGRAVGVAAARGRYIAFVDGHCRIDSKTLLADMVAIFSHTDADCLARPQPLVPTAGSAVASAVSLARSSPFGHSAASRIFSTSAAASPSAPERSTGDAATPASSGTRGDPCEGVRATSPVSHGAMYRREVFEKIGTFDPAFDACEDVELNWRVEHAGLSSFESDRLAVRYEPRASFVALFRQMRRYGLGRARLHRKHPAAFRLESLVPVAFVVGLLALAAAPWLPRIVAWPVVCTYALYAVLSVGFAIGAAARSNRSLAPIVAWAFPVIHVGLGVGYLAGLARFNASPSAMKPPSAGVSS